MRTPPSSDSHAAAGGGVTAHSRGRSVLSFRRNQVASMDQAHDPDQPDFDLFQSHVADLLLSLLPAPADAGDHHFLSFAFVSKLIDAVLRCDDEFRALLRLLAIRNPAQLSRPPFDRLLSELIDRAVKSLDICNAVSHALASMREWRRQADIAAFALLGRPPEQLGQGQLNRARKALARLLPAVSHEESSNGGKAERAWSFGRGNNHNNSSTNSSDLSSKSTPWCVSRNWSAARQLQAMSAGLAARDAGAGLALATQTMSAVLVFAMWAMVAAFPCQDRGGHTGGPVAAPKTAAWAGAMGGLQERIGEEWRRRERKGGPAALVGLLAELQVVERSGKGVMEVVVAAEKDVPAEEVAERAEELAEAGERLGKGLGPMEKQVREMFHRIVRSRVELQQLLEQSTRAPAPPLML